MNDKILDIIEGIMADYGQALTNGIKANIQKYKKIKTGSLYNSVHFIVNRLGERVVVEILANDYLEYVDGNKGKKTIKTIAKVSSDSARSTRSKRTSTRAKKQSERAGKSSERVNIVQGALDGIGDKYFIEINDAVTLYASKEMAEAFKTIPGTTVTQKTV